LAEQSGGGHSAGSNYSVARFSDLLRPSFSATPMKHIPIIERAASFGSAVAIQDGTDQHSYRDLLERSVSMAATLLDSKADLEEKRIAFQIPPGFAYVSVQWGIWQAGGIAVPLSISATEQELEHSIGDSGVSCVVTTEDLATKIRSHAKKRNTRIVIVDEIGPTGEFTLPQIELTRRAMILYTSGTTSRPKGVVTTHACIQSQIECLVKAWHWTSKDRVPLFLPLHHIHGIINVLACGLWSGARVETFSKFDIDRVFDRVAHDAYTVFMAVPTIYVKMIQALESLSKSEREPILSGFRKMRLMISGSAALPSSVQEHWTNLTTQRLLERYGMTEIGMALSNPYEGERRAGTVGQPLPSVKIRLMSEQGDVIAAENESGEIQVQGPGVFLEYWKRPVETGKSFQDGWFRTGDIATFENGYYRIMGRSSIDIIKSGGYKLSALEIEAALLDHSAIRQCAVIGLPNETWGETVAAAVVLRTGDQLELEELKIWCEGRLSHYKIPRCLLCVDQLPRNAMGKVTKPALLKLFAGPESDT